MKNLENQNPFLFACGVPRSGTTVLQRMLNHHPEMAIVNDSHFIPRALELTNNLLVDQAVRGKTIPLTPELVHNARTYHRFWRMDLTAREFELALNRADTYQQFVSGLYDAFAIKSQKPLAGEKTPDYVRRLSLLHGLFPAAKLIHLVRDGRDVALSLMDWATPTKGPGRFPFWKEQPTAVCALWWKWLVMAARTQQSQLAVNIFLEIRYERLVAHAAATMREVCDFLEVPYHDRLIEYHQGKSKNNPELSTKSAWLAPKAGLRNWRTDMETEQVALFEALAADALAAHGYELSVTKFSDQTLETARKCQSWWNQNFLTKHESKNASVENATL